MKGSHLYADVVIKPQISLVRIYRVPQKYVLAEIRAARSFFLFKPMMVLFCGVVVAVAVVVSYKFIFPNDLSQYTEQAARM